MRGWLALLLAVVTLTIIDSSVAVAQDAALCSRLRAQLDRFDDGEVAAVPVYRNDAAIRQQRQKIDKIRSDLYSLDCGGGSIIVFNNRTQSMCRRVAAALDREEAELERLLRQRNAAAAPAPRGSAARQRILAALRANGCPEDDGVRIRQSLDLEGDENLIDLDDPYSRYRTVCVRTCDGYYFPVSFSASPLQFVSDAQRCAEMCPAADVDLYFHKVPDQESEDMVSAVDQTPYRDLPTAFAYRTSDRSDDPQCTCQASAPIEDIAVEQDSGRSIVVISPENKPDDENAKQPETAEQAPAREIDPTRRVRVVGPKFLPDQSEAIDLRAPVPSESR
ncbi:DUF2865 domain-containing protein [Hoeflea sp.]|uniref:DUF2865 domain-containing protein n=1 Tax=Hoeflea sp. TaxID=1940281 RepID=UPI003B026FDC